MTENNQQPQNAIQITAQYIKDLSFEAPEIPFSLATMKQMPEIKIDIDLKANKAKDMEDTYVVELTIRVNGTDKESQKTVFLCELTYGALAIVKVPQEHVEPVLLVDIPMLIFPYARAVIGNTMREAGFPSLQINPIDFVGLYRSKKAQQSQPKEETKQ